MVPIPAKINKGESTGYKRDPEVAAAALKKANFKCEIDHDHETFTSNATKLPYVEAHHLIPMSKQSNFKVSLDVTANIAALCPMCHRLLHHGMIGNKKKHILSLLEQRTDRLKEKKIELDGRELLGYYHNPLLGDDD
jgi:5-methylcytosine-specific restriction protein A